MSLAGDIRTYLVEMQALARLHADLAAQGLVPQVKWGKLAARTGHLRKRVEASIERKRCEEKEA